MSADWIKLMIVAALFSLRCDSVNKWLESPGAKAGYSFRPVVIDRYAPIVQVARQRYPAFQVVIESFGRCRSVGHQTNLYSTK